MKKFLALVFATIFVVSLNANKVKKRTSIWQNTKDRCNEVYSKTATLIKENKYVKYGFIGTGAIVATTGAGYVGCKYFKANELTDTVGD